MLKRSGNIGLSASAILIPALAVGCEATSAPSLAGECECHLGSNHCTALSSQQKRLSRRCPVLAAIALVMLFCSRCMDSAVGCTYLHMQGKQDAAHNLRGCEDHREVTSHAL